MKPLDRLGQTLPVGILAISLMAVYLSSMAPGLSWANYGADGGDLIAAAATGGVAHPTGYPLYLLLARLFQLIPIGSLAFRTNLLSSIAATLAAVVVYDLLTRSLTPSKPRQSWLPGMASGFAFGLAPLVWSQAVITEVYTLHILFVALILHLSFTTVPSQFLSKHRDGLLGLIFGLAMGNHITILLLLPVLLFGTILRNPDLMKSRRFIHGWLLDRKALWHRMIWLGVGLLVYLTLPLRALSNPAVNWGNPVSLDGFGWLVTGKLYQGQLFNGNIPSILERVRVVVASFLEQFGIPGLTIGLMGLIVYFRPNRIFLSTLWILLASSLFAIGYGTTDAFMYLIPAFLCFALWIGLGLSGLIKAISPRFQTLGLAIGLVFLLILFVQAGTHWRQVDASQDQRAEQFGEDVLALAPQDAIVFAQGDRAVFTLWYFQFALQTRLDLAIIATDLLQFDWYLT
jgi:hypothetical protein